MNAEISAARDDLRATLDRLGQNVNRLTAHAMQGQLLSPGYTAAITFRTGPDMEARLARFMFSNGITNQALAIRLLLTRALNDEEGQS